MSKPKENPDDKKARLRERRLSEVERAGATQDNASGLTADVRAIYGMQPKGAPSQPFKPTRSGGIINAFKSKGGEGRLSDRLNVFSVKGPK